MRAALALCVIATAVACRTFALEFTCTADPQCERNGSQGVCVASDDTGGLCAFPSTNCPSGFAYDSSAGSKAGECVVFSPADMATTDDGDLSQPTDGSSNVDGITTGDMSNGIAWTRTARTGVFRSVWMRSSDEIYVVGHGGLIIKFSGGQWSAPLPSGTTENLETVWGDRATGDVWAGGANNTLIHSSNGGASWQQETFSYQPGSVFCVWGTSKSDIYATGNSKLGLIIHSDGSGVWSTPQAIVTGNASYYFKEIRGSSPTNLWAITANAAEVWKSTGDGNWSRDYVWPTPPTNLFVHIFVAGMNDIYVSSGRALLYSTGNGTWTQQLTEPTNVVDGAGPTFIITANASSLLRSTGSAGSWMPILTLSDGFAASSVLNSTEMTLVGNGVILQGTRQ